MKPGQNAAALWMAKLDARLHDPAEKSLILMRTSHGHEGGTSQTLRAALFKEPLSPGIQAAVRKADHWASAADRAAFPNHVDDGRYPHWQQVEFHKRPVIIHPLTGTQIDMRDLSDIEPAQAEAIALAHFQTLIHTDDHRRTALAFWRFGPQLENDDLRSLWPLLPADTRVPNHSIWDHLDLTAAFATAFAAAPDDDPALFAVSIGPVQEFIAASRSTSDLWAGSHFLSRLAWEAMKVICEEFGPEAILFPRLRGIPQVDVWLRDECGLKHELFSHCEWVRDGKTDANPLFTAALPNRFTALLPTNRAAEVGAAITQHLREWVLTKGKEVYRLLLQKAGVADDDALPGYRQLEDQLASFPEVHWAAVSWSLVGTATGKVDVSDNRLATAMATFFSDTPPGFLGSATWKLLSKGIELEKGSFWQPNPGALYPAIHELLERLLAATKSLRAFPALAQEGWRCSLTGESEWLTTDRSQLKNKPNTNPNTLWNKVAKAQPSWAKRGEHLGALASIKRLWPVLFTKELENVLEADDVQRFVVSTHTMAVVSDLISGLETGQLKNLQLEDEILKHKPAALPRGLLKRIKAARVDGQLLRRLPAWLDAQTDNEDGAAIANRKLRKLLGHDPETYYAVLQMDGDEMGGWLAAAGDKTAPNSASFHPQILSALSARFGTDGGFTTYAQQNSPGNPARHMAISDALSNFALKLVPEIVEVDHCGKVIYAGGDDVLAMLPVRSALMAAMDLRASYAGMSQEDLGVAPSGAAAQRPAQKNGFVLQEKKQQKKLLRMMGDNATASAGLVVAHHKAPLNFVLGELRQAEKRAKTAGGRDALSITLIKQAGGTTLLTLKWRTKEEHPLYPVCALMEFVAAISKQEASRRAAYIVLAWLKDLPSRAALDATGKGSLQKMLATLLGFQFSRQGLPTAQPLADKLAALAERETDPAGFVGNFLTVAEFLARDTRS